MKNCSRCSQVKDVTEFRVRSGRTDYSSYCRPCEKEYHLELRDRLRMFLLTYLQSHPCVDCGESDIVVLEFDHLPHHKKQCTVSSLLTGASIKRLQAEIDKCEVVCSNCHTRRTANRAGWWKLNGSEGFGNPASL